MGFEVLAHLAGLPGQQMSPLARRSGVRFHADLLAQQ
jgi:hypothetical protein